MKSECISFLIEATEQVEKRLPASKDLFKGLSGLHPKRVLKANGRLAFGQLPLAHLRAAKSDQIEEHSRKIIPISWEEEPVLNGALPGDTVKFWSGIYHFQNGLGENPFQELANYAFTCLTNPVSNAVVERIFSQVTAVKTKLEK
eukprot:Seg5878.3 transcript_id=Seg5878.3/GoldUCD/mRNA.D3Y31 product="hypothetical protein" protein_id=Seg5878.3/GoldUCD/D3Y31